MVRRKKDSLFRSDGKRISKKVMENAFFGRCWAQCLLSC
jgi:hypothetical protein